ncbi:hypothetical protein GF322_01475 [Candidatus Dependentiae bacterium]|nr:hypothetical protein [Candidatus Dependentiae bacterium]
MNIKINIKKYFLFILFFIFLISNVLGMSEELTNACIPDDQIKDIFERCKIFYDNCKESINEMRIFIMGDSKICVYKKKYNSLKTNIENIFGIDFFKEGIICKDDFIDSIVFNFLQKTVIFFNSENIDYNLITRRNQSPHFKRNQSYIISNDNNNRICIFCN